MKVPGRFFAYAWIAPGFTSEAAKHAVHFVRLEATKGLPSDRDFYVTVPAGQFERNPVTLEWHGEDGRPVRMVSARSINGSYPCPPDHDPNWLGAATIQDANVTLTKPTHEILASRNPGRVTLRVTPAERHVGLGTVGVAEAGEVTIVQRMREAIDDAADQLAKAQAVCPFPGVVVVHDHDPFAAGLEDLTTACFGDLTMEIRLGPIGSEPEAGLLQLGRNGVLRGGKNRSVSAVTYRSRGRFKTISIINPGAAYTARPGWLEGTVYEVRPDGSIREVTQR